MLTESELTILGLVAEAPRYGYEIEQIIDERNLREWLKIGSSSIYYTLDKLKSQKLLTITTRDNTTDPSQKIYNVSEAGYGVLQTAIVDLLRQSRPLGAGFELGLVNLSLQTPQQAHTALWQHYLDLQKHIERVENQWLRWQEENEIVPDHVWALYSHHLAIAQAELMWLAEFLEEWRRRHPAVTIDPEADIDALDTSQRPTPTHRHDTEETLKQIQRLKRPSTPSEG